MSYLQEDSGYLKNNHLVTITIIAVVIITAIDSNATTMVAFKRATIDR